jgi:unsaturated rhamnogalacturonyl hydrolase
MLFVVLASAVLAASATVEADVRSVAALPGEPAIVSAAGITRAETPIVTVENRSAFEATRDRRLVLVGGLDGDEASARAVVEAMRWLKTTPAARRSWIVSALPLADPDRRGAPALQFPPEKGFFDDPERPESRYVWRWITYQAPDLVVVFSQRDSASAASLEAALSANRAAGPGRVPVVSVHSIDAFKVPLAQVTGRTTQSPLHRAILERANRDPLALAKTLAARYPETPSISYIPAVAWVNTLRLGSITHDDAWRAKVERQVAPWTSRAKPLFGDRIQLTAIAVTMIFADLAAAGDSGTRRLADEGAALAAKEKTPGVAEYGGGWTDDMFMASSVLARADTRQDHPQALDTAVRLLVDYAARLQRPDGLFNHAPDAPAAWGRGNGFAAFGLMEALTVMPASHPARSRVLDIYRRQMTAARSRLAPDGMWREVLDEPGSYRELTATAMLMTAMARGVRLGWLDASHRPTVERAWRALAAHVMDDGTLVDVCASTGGGTTRRYYLDRPAIAGPDDRGGAMALFAAVELSKLRRLATPRRAANSSTERTARSAR